eukprot:TRINITY_DN2744_c0_g1_i1.p1 TRINITY_DN2744_c0_g1~~TRINITY_DN2744_c0_g1_i1.p1  ORF type:complete len:464 (-),score=105.07 TRINITY_DN2744_c0_g1_i1:204-1595(-)
MRGKLQLIPEENLIEEVEVTRKSFQEISTQDKGEKREPTGPKIDLQSSKGRQKLGQKEQLLFEDEETQEGVNRQKIRFSDEEVALLEELFAFTSRPSKVLRVKVATFLGLPPKTIRIWFQNRRAKAKKTESNDSQDSPPPAETKRSLSKNVSSLVEQWKQEEIELRKKKAEESMLPFVKTLKMSGGNFQEVRMEFDFSQPETSKSDSWGKKKRAEVELPPTSRDDNQVKKLCTRKWSVPKQTSENTELAHSNSVPSLINASRTTEQQSCITPTTTSMDHSDESFLDERVIEAIKTGRKEEVICFLNKIHGRVNVSHFRVNNLPLLHLATLTRQKEVCELLIKAGANVMLRNSQGNTALDLAQYNNFTEIVEVLRSPFSQQPMVSKTNNHSENKLQHYQPHPASLPSLFSSSAHLSSPLSLFPPMNAFDGRGHSFAVGRQPLPSLYSLLRDNNSTSFDLPPLKN